MDPNSRLQSTKMSRLIYLPSLIVAGSFILYTVPLMRAQESLEPRDLTVTDAIEMTVFADSNYLMGQSSKGRVAQFSPDENEFVVVLRKGDVRANTNKYSAFLFNTGDVFKAPRPELLTSVSSLSN